MSKWEMVKLGDVCNVERGGSPRPIDQFITEDENGINWIKIGDTSDNNMYITKTKQKIIPEGMKKSRYVQPGDFLLSNSMSFGRPYILKIDGCIHDGWLVLRDKNNYFHKEYLYHALSSKATYEKFKSLAVGGVVNNLNSTIVKQVEFPLPPLEIQKQIAKTLDTAAELLAMRKQQLAELDNLIKSTFYDMFGDPVTNEKGWDMKCVDEIADTRLGKMRDKQFITGNHLKYYLGNSNVKWFSFSFDKMEQMDFDDDEQLKYSLQDGDLLVCEGGEIGRCAIWKCEMKDVYFQKALHRIRVKKYIVNQYYLAYVFYLFSLGNGFENVTNRATIAHLTGVKLKKILIPIPPVTLQKQFAEIVTKIEEQKAFVKKAIDETQYLFDSLMSQYFE